MKKLLAFTLAETLIVIGIIGVVSALTLPNLNSSTGEKEKVAKVKKIYRDLNDAVGRAVAVYGPIDEWKSLDTTANAQVTRFGERITEFMKVSKNCKTTVNQGCFAKKWVLFNTTTQSGINDSIADYYRFILADGTSVILNFSQIYVDIDGPNKGSQRLGVDIFYFLIEDNSISLYLHDKDISTLIKNIRTDLSGGEGNAASTWIMNYDNMDYLKLDTSGKCSNGTAPTDDNPRCN